jgi:hypothetical protein
MPNPFGIERLYTQLGFCHGPAGGAPAAGTGGGVPVERIPLGTPPNLARRGEIATKTQEPRPTTKGLYLNRQKGVRWALHGKGGVRHAATNWVKQQCSAFTMCRPLESTAVRLATNRQGASLDMP